MLFQTLDDKKECVGVYFNKKLEFSKVPEGLTKTWSYSPFLKGKDIDYATLYIEGKSLEDACPEHFKNELTLINNKLKAFINSFIEAKISLKNNCFFDLTPAKFLEQHCELKNKITQYVLENNKKPKEYEFYRRFTELLTDLRYQELNIDLEVLKPKLAEDKILTFYRKMLETNYYVEYNLFGSITGRLTTTKNSFPIQTFSSLYREVLKPKNDWFVSFDVNAAELRTALGLLGKKQPEEDLYTDLSTSVFNDSLGRTEIKKATTAWLYSSNNSIGQQYNRQLENYFNKSQLKNKYWDGKYINTPFSRKIESDDYHAISHLNQSTFIDLFHRQIIKVNDYLNGNKSFISFLLHDEFVVDMADDEKNKIIDIIKILQDTQYGKFLINVKVGKNFGNMKKLKLKE